MTRVVLLVVPCPQPECITRQIRAQPGLLDSQPKETAGLYSGMLRCFIALATVVGYITDYLGWMYMLMTSFFLGFAIWLSPATARSGSVGRTTNPSSAASRGSRCSSRRVSAWCLGPSPSPSRTTLIRPWPSRRRRMLLGWPCRRRSSTGGCTRGRSTPSSASPSRTRSWPTTRTSRNGRCRRSCADTRSENRWAPPPRRTPASRGNHLESTSPGTIDRWTED
jgi:hypothetical protein